MKGFIIATGAGLLLGIGMVGSARAQEFTEAWSHGAAGFHGYPCPTGSQEISIGKEAELVVSEEKKRHECHCEWLEKEGVDEEVEGGFIAHAEYLLLKPRRRSLDYAIIDPIDNARPDGYIESVDWKLQSGFRVGLGYKFRDGWEVAFLYTYLHSDTEGSVNRPINGTLYATRTHPILVEQVDTATALTSLTYNVFDGEVGRWFEVGESFEVRPFAGVRFGHINQGLDIYYDGQDADRDRINNFIDFEGGGVRLGCQGQWKWGCGFSLYGRGSASLLIGDFQTRYTETEDGALLVIANVNDSFQKVIPVMELGLGLAYHYRNLRVSAGYEFINWFGLVDTLDFADDVHQGKMSQRSGDLSLDGLVLRAELGF